MSDNEKKNITLGDWNKFFQSIRPVFEKHKAILEEKRKRGDFFNVFSVLGIEKLEVKTHSAFIAELLNPNGSHGLGDRFLLEFLKVIPKGEEFIINENTKVTPEFYIGPKQNDDADEGGRLDIIIDNLDSYIIIENKINAEDVKKQLIRYYNYAQKRGNKFILLYLTLDGEEASNISTKGKNINTNKNIKLQAGEHYYPISYRNHIVLWLERCLEIATQHPRVRESITQYIDLIKKLTNTEDMDEKIKTLILNDNNIWITAELLDNNNNIKDSIIKYIIKKNTNKIPSIEWEYDSEKNDKYLFRPKGWKIFWFSLWAPTQNGCSFCIYCESKHQDTIENSIEHFKLGVLTSKEYKKPYPFGEFYLNEAKNYKNLLKLEFDSYIKEIMEDIEINEQMKQTINLDNNNITLAECFKTENK